MHGDGWYIVDTAGWTIGQDMQKDERLFRTIHAGLKRNTNLLDEKEWGAKGNRKKRNAAHALALVINGSHLVGQRIQKHTTKERHMLFFTKTKTHETKVAEFDLDGHTWLPEHYRVLSRLHGSCRVVSAQCRVRGFCSHVRTGTPPVVIVTHIAEATRKGLDRTQLLRELNNVVHGSRIFFLECSVPDQPNVLHETREQLHALFQKLNLDLASAGDVDSDDPDSDDFD